LNKLYGKLDKLWTQSEKDKGSNFYFTLPFTKLAESEKTLKTNVS
jgi:signal transduction histidine kinase